MSNWFRWPWSRKESPTRSLIAVQRLGQPVATPQNYEGYAKEGYSKNVIAFKAVSGISKAVAGVPWVLYNKRTGGKRQEIMEHPLLTLLRRPNKLQGQTAFFEAVASFYMISGNSYIYINAPERSLPLELWVERPDRMRIIPGEIGLPQAYEYTVGGAKHRYMVDQVKGTSPIMHLKTFNPIDDWYGMSPIQAASLSIDQHNASGVWNAALLQNKATPSGALVMAITERNPSGKLDDKQYERLDKKLEEKFMGSQNAGRPMILEGGLDWKQMGFSPTDMEWIEGKNTSARDIALAFGYPPVLLGIQGDSTYNNQREARMALYEETVIPIAEFIRDEFNNSLTPAFGDSLQLDIDLDKVEALAPKREAIWSRVGNAEFLKYNEKREAVGYEPTEGGDTLLVQASLIPIDMALSDDVAGDPVDEDLDQEEDAKSLEFKASESKFEQFVREFTERHVGVKVTGLQRTTRKRVIQAIRDAQVQHLQDGTNLQEFSKDMRARVDGLYDGFTKGRSRTIARTETTVAANEGARGAAKSLGLPNMKKSWLSADDERVRGSDDDDSTNHMKMNGVTVGIDEKFLVPSEDGPDEMDGPGDPAAPVDQVANCRCIQTFESDSKSLNLNSDAAKRRYWLKTIRTRSAIERKFAAQVSAVFKKEGQDILSALDGIEDARLAEAAIDHVLDDSKSDMAVVLRANITGILKQFGRDILKIGS